MSVPFALGSDSAPVLWTGAKVFGGYKDINKLIGSYGGADVKFTDRNLAPLIMEVKSKQGKKRKLPKLKEKNENSDKKLSIEESRNEIAPDDSLISPRTIIAGLGCGPDYPNENEKNCPSDYAWAPNYVDSAAYLSSSNGTDWTGAAWTEFLFPAGVRTRALMSYTHDSLTHCQPVFLVSSAPCGGGFQSDAVWVPDATLEIEYDMYNPTCTDRSGTNSVDITRGCIVAFSLSSNMPSSYLDTTLLDPDNYFNMTVGTSAPEQFQTGYTYRVERVLQAQNLDVQAHTAGPLNIVRAQVGTRINLFCSFGTENCVFAVDTRKLKEKNWQTY